MEIRELNISARSKYCLLNAGYVDDLKEVTNETISEIHNLNEKRCVRNTKCT